MNFLKRQTIWTNAELIPLKICIASAYILVGAWFYTFVRHYDIFFILAFAVALVISLYFWITKMKGRMKKDASENEPDKVMTHYH